MDGGCDESQKVATNADSIPMSQYAVIIPTTCTTERASLLLRAVASVDVKQSELVVVANGPRVDEVLLHELRGLGARVYRQEVGNVSSARCEGVARSHAPLFSFLDDDDEFLPGGLERRAALFHSELACVVTNGYLRIGAVDTPLVPADIAESINADPMGSFFQLNWFASPASMFQRAKFPLGLFDTSLKYFEWTQLLFRIVDQGLAFHYEDELTYRKYEDHPYSVSKTAEYSQAYPAFLREEILNFKLNPDVRQVLLKKYAIALNTLSFQALLAGHRRAAWAAHVECLLAGGWQYLPYTRKLLV